MSTDKMNLEKFKELLQKYEDAFNELMDLDESDANYYKIYHKLSKKTLRLADKALNAKIIEDHLPPTLKDPPKPVYVPVTKEECLAMFVLSDGSKKCNYADGKGKTYGELYENRIDYVGFLLKYEMDKTEGKTIPLERMGVFVRL